MADPHTMSEDVLAYLKSNAEHVGLDVVFDPAMSCLPCLRDVDGGLVPLYQVIEAIDGQVDIEEAVKDVSGLTYCQVTLTLAFVRGLVQGNLKGVCVDDVEDECDLENGLAEDIGEVFDAEAERGKGAVEELFAKEKRKTIDANRVCPRVHIHDMGWDRCIPPSKAPPDHLAMGALKAFGCRPVSSCYPRDRETAAVNDQCPNWPKRDECWKRWDRIRR